MSTRREVISRCHRRVDGEGEREGPPGCCFQPPALSRSIQPGAPGLESRWADAYVCVVIGCGGSPGLDAVSSWTSFFFVRVVTSKPTPPRPPDCLRSHLASRISPRSPPPSRFCFVVAADMPRQAVRALKRRALRLPHKPSMRRTTPSNLVGVVVAYTHARWMPLHHSDPHPQTKQR